MTASPAELLRLGTRAGVSDDVAFLRAHYPREDWRAHANFGQLADFWLHVHAALRHEGDEVSRTVDAFRDRRIDGPTFGRAFVPRLNGFLQHLDQHHHIEDEAYFPKFRQLDDRMVAGFDLLLRHLSDEEDLVIPAMLAHGERQLR